MKKHYYLSKIRYWFTDTALYRWVLSAILHPKTFFFLKRYPFWKSYNVWTRRFSGWGYSLYDWLPSGWKKAFGEGLTADIVEALESDGIPKRKWTEALQFQDIKEKYGTLRMYATATEKVQDVLSKYECLSCGYCESCGKPARYITDGWISYLCEDCFEKGYDGANFKPSGQRLTEEDIPCYYTYGKDGEETKRTPLERWGIDLKKIWGIE